MGILGIRKQGEQEIALVRQTEYKKQHREEELHRSVAMNPRLILRETVEGEPLPALTVASHFTLGDVQGDLLVVDLSGTILVVELKRDRAPRDVIAQILDYAARVHEMGMQGLQNILREQGKYPDGVASILVKLLDDNPAYKDTEFDDASRFDEQVRRCIAGKDLQLVVVSYVVDEDVQRVVEYLRTVYGIRIYCVEFDYYQSEGYEYFVPEIIGAATRDVVPEPTDRQEEYREFWTLLLDKLRQEIPDVTQRGSTPQSYLRLPVGHTGIHFEWAFHGRPRSWFEVGIHFERPEREANVALLEQLRKDKATIEQEIGEPIQFEENWGSRWSRAYASRSEGQMTDSLRNWAVETTVKFYKLLKPRVDALDGVD